MSRPVNNLNSAYSALQPGHAKPLYLTTFVAAEMLLHRNQKQHGMVLKMHAFLGQGYGMQESQTTSNEKFKAMVLIAVVDCADCI